MPYNKINGTIRIDEIPERCWNRKIIRGINETIFDYEKLIIERQKKQNKLKNKIWQKTSNIIPPDLDERIEKYLNTKK